MINFVRRLLGLRPDKDTEARQLKAALHDNVAKLKQKASKGDSDASLKLGALRESLSEQSVRLLPPHGPKMILFAVITVLALGIGGVGCGGGLAAKTAKDIETANSMILPEYLQYVETDPKLKNDQKQDRKNQVRALQDVVRAAQK